MSTITAVIPTYNEETNISDCINSLKSFVERVIVMDFNSIDKTKEIAERLGATVYQSDMTYKKRINIGINLDEIKSDWVIYIDADERLTDKSSKELKKLCDKYANHGQINGIVLHYRFFFMGKLLNYGFQPYKMRLFKKGTAYMENIELDEHLVLKQGKSVRMKSYIIHYDFKGLDKFILKLNGFSERAAQEYIEIKENRRSMPFEGLAAVSKFRRKVKFNIYYKLPISIRSYLYYIYYYYINMGFLDGVEGKMFLFLYIYWYKYLTDAYIYEKRINEKQFKLVG